MGAKALMVQGTASDSGKSTLVTGLCRHYANQGLRVFPYKSQNMASNSAYTPDGKEISRAQLTQAEAARRPADVRMNPIFLKPSSDTGSNVILNGRPLGHMSAREYDSYKPRLRELIREGYQEIQEENDLIILEGAGSPAEINLQENDLVNMGMADIADCPVILVADIDLGGVFASIYGTIELQRPDHRARIKGVIINKFRGDKDLLEPGLDMIEELTGVPVIGVIPYLDIDLEEEDSLALARAPRQRDPGKDLDLGILDLPGLANFADFKSLSLQGDVSLRLISQASELAQADLVILPDSLKVQASLDWLEETGLGQALKNYLDQGGRVLGLGAGYYILGQELIDQKGLARPGLGLIPFRAIFKEEGDFGQVNFTYKALEVQALARSLATVQPLDEGARPILEGHGLARQDGRVLGTDLAGSFENLNLIRQGLDEIRRDKGLGPIPVPSLSYAAYKDQAYDRLAGLITDHIYMDKLNEIIDRG